MRTVVLLVLAACSESTSTPSDGGADSAGPDALGGTCQGPCLTTNLVAMFKRTRTLDRAYFGINSDDNTLRVEAYKRAGTGCPTPSSPTPDYTLIVGRLPMPTSMDMLDSPANILDFKGDLLGGALGVGATTRVITPVAYHPKTDIALDVMLTFSGGTVTGHLYATYCTSLDQ